jgi:chemotaxis protein methyltransferase CheR
MAAETATDLSSASMDPADFDWLAAEVRQGAGVQLDRSRLTLAEARLLPLLRELGLSAFSALFALARGGGESAALRRRMIESLLTGETLFFRDLHPFEALRERLLPALLPRRPQRRLRFWSAAASTGQEAYSLAMLLQDAFPQLAAWQVSILGTDFSEASLRRAREGSYSSLEVNRGLGAEALMRHFEPLGQRWRIREHLRRQVDFEVMDLTRAWPRREPFDVIFLRNVLIYFDDETKRRIMRWAAQALAPDGVLFLGSAETTLNLVEGLRRTDLPQSCCFVRSA